MFWVVKISITGILSYSKKCTRGGSVCEWCLPSGEKSALLYASDVWTSLPKRPTSSFRTRNVCGARRIFRVSMVCNPNVALILMTEIEKSRQRDESAPTRSNARRSNPCSKTCAKTGRRDLEIHVSDIALSYLSEVTWILIDLNQSLTLITNHALMRFWSHTLHSKPAGSDSRLNAVFQAHLTFTKEPHLCNTWS